MRLSKCFDRVKYSVFGLLVKVRPWEVCYEFKRKLEPHELEGEQAYDRNIGTIDRNIDTITIRERVVVPRYAPILGPIWSEKRAQSEVNMQIEKKYGPKLIRVPTFQNTHEYRGLEPIEMSVHLPFAKPRHI